MRKRALSTFLVCCMVTSSLAGCGGSNSSNSAANNSSSNATTDGSDTASNESTESTYTYNWVTGSISSWSPTDWQISTERDILGYTCSGFWEFQLNETYDGYDIVPELAADFPTDVTSEYAGNETYGVPSGETEGYAWKITLRQDACWDDGTPINADTVEYTLQQYLNPEMKNYRASTFYSGTTGLANARAYYESGANVYEGLWDTTTMADLTVGDDGQYVDADGNQLYIGWSVTDDHWMGGAALTDYESYFDAETFAALNDLVNADGYIALTEETKELLYSFTSSDDWGNESEDDFINYVYKMAGVGEVVDWSNVGFIRNDDYTFTIILCNPVSEFDLEYGFSLYLIKEDLYEANKQETGGVIKSTYGTSVDTYASYGPYKVTSYQEGKEIVCSKNENWYGYSDGQHEGQYQTTAINLQMIDEKSTQISLFLQGKLDRVGLSSDYFDTYGTSDYINFTPESYTYYLTLNTASDLLEQQQTEGVNKLIYTYEDFRHALSLCIDRNEYVKTCSPSSSAAFGLLNNIYVCDPTTGELYRDSEYAQQALCNVYGVSNIDELTGYDKDKASELLQSAYDQCLADGNINETDVIEIEYHVYGTSSIYQKIVDFVNDSLQAAAVGTSLENRISVVLVEDPDYYTTMKNGQDDMILGSWGGETMNPYAMMECYTNPDYIIESGFDSTKDLTISVQGTEITKSYYDWFVALCEGEYATADTDVRNEILAGMEAGLLSDYHIIPMYSLTTAYLSSQRIIYPCEYVNALVERGGFQFMTYSMDDAEWEAYCEAQGNELTY